MPQILRAVGESLDWVLGARWALDRDGGELRCAEMWTASARTLDEFADINQRMAELALDIEGAYAPLARGDEHAVAGGAWQYSFLRTRANSIEGGTTDILRNIIAERVLGLPKMR